LGDSFAITREGDHLVYRRYSSKPFRSQSVRISPNEHQWQAFWAEAEAVSLWKWKSSYKPTGIVNDGTHWSIEIEHDGRKVRAHGDNAYPGDLSPAISAERSKRYTRFLSAIRTLTSGRKFY
jgi:hypothetical protein